MSRKNYLVAYRTFFALLGFSAIVTEIAVLVERGRFNSANFFSYFTIETNILAVVVLLLGAYAATQKARTDWIDMFRGASTMYMVTVLIVFDNLLANLEGAILTAAPWDNIVLHYIIPFAVLVDWILDPPKRRIAYKVALWWLVFPIAYVIYSLIRGSITDWYPYPFLDPATSGYIGVVVVSAGITCLVLGLAWLITRFPLKKS